MLQIYLKDWDSILPPHVLDMPSILLITYSQNLFIKSNRIIFATCYGLYVGQRGNSLIGGLKAINVMSPKILRKYVLE